MTINITLAASSVSRNRS